MRAICSRSDNRKNERKIKKHRKCVQRKCDCVCIILVARVFRCAEISYNNIFKKSNPKMSWVISMSYFFCALASCWLETGIQILDLYFHKLINYIEYPNDMINESNIICIDQFASVKHRRNNKRFSDNWRNAFFFQLHHCINWELHFVRRQINDDFAAILWLNFIHDHFFLAETEVLTTLYNTAKAHRTAMFYNGYNSFECFRCDLTVCVCK